MPRPSAIPLVLASPFTAWNFLAGQNGFLTGSLLGAALLCLQRRPVLAGIFIGCLSYKPQFGILLPVALIAARQWRAIASAAVTVVALAVLSAAAFGIGAWEMLPTGLLAQKNVVLLAGGAADADANWGHIQTIYGLVRELHGGGVFAILLHCAGALAVAVIVWRVWRSSASYDLKAAAVSAAALIATPYAFSYDMAALAIPVAFVARDQLRDGLLRREQATLLALFGIVLTAFGAFWVNQDNFDFGRMPLGLIALVTVMFLIMRRAAIPVFFQKRQWT